MGFLLDQVLSWKKNSSDPVHGGYYTIDSNKLLGGLTMGGLVDVSKLFQWGWQIWSGAAIMKGFDNWDPETEGGKIYDAGTELLPVSDQDDEGIDWLSTWTTRKTQSLMQETNAMMLFVGAVLSHIPYSWGKSHSGKRVSLVVRIGQRVFTDQKAWWAWGIFKATWPFAVNYTAMSFTPGSWVYSKVRQDG